MHREQKTGKPGYQAKDRLEVEGAHGVWSTGVLGTTNGDSAIGQEPGRSLLDAILSVNNMFDAQERVISNRGSAGVDGMTVTSNA